ncbi:MAG TPA: metallophosphoesterase [Gammaproteobacteria bacterium]|nr:metallophosphoesterase [Gammaproteobacteria bacterium]
MIAYVTDVEGRWDKLTTFVEGNPHVAIVDGRLQLADGVTFVFGGDAIDRGSADRRFVALLLAAKRTYGDRVVLLAGNRDINKLRLVYELGGKPHRRAPSGLARADLLRWTLANTMGAGTAFEHRLTGLRDAGLPATDDTVVASYLDDLAPGGDMRAYLDACQLGFRANDTLFLHGGVTAENFLRTPGAGPAADVDDWLARLARFYRDEMETFARGTRPDALIAYQSQGPDKLNQGSVVYARPTDEHGNPQLPPADIISRLLADGIRRVVVGHTPSGDCPAILRDGDFELVLADNSYGRIERGSQVFVDAALHVAARTRLDDGTEHAVRYASEAGPPLGLRVEGTGQLVKARLATGDYLLFRGLPEYKVMQVAASAETLGPLITAR